MTAKTLKMLAATALAAGAVMTGTIGQASAVEVPSDVTDGVGTIQTENFKVSVTSIENFNHKDSVANVEVCATKVPAGETVPVSRAPWTINTVDGPGQKPRPDSTYPQGGEQVQLAQGQCTTGALSYKSYGMLKSVDYHNSLGDTAHFRFDS